MAQRGASTLLCSLRTRPSAARPTPPVSPTACQRRECDRRSLHLQRAAVSASPKSLDSPNVPSISPQFNRLQLRRRLRPTSGPKFGPATRRDRHCETALQNAVGVLQLGARFILETTTDTNCTRTASVSPCRGPVAALQRRSAVTGLHFCL